jgi:hypothetical protein
MANDVIKTLGGVGADLPPGSILCGTIRRDSGSALVISDPSDRHSRRRS